jgi:Flp pilus assembly pilin Flp
MEQLVQWLKRPIALERDDDQGGQAVEYSLIVVAASAIVAYALIPATSGLAASIAAALADLLPQIGG